MEKPDWIRVKAYSGKCDGTNKLLEKGGLHTVCEEAACPNMGNCWSRGHAAIMILGSKCTRNCRFCNISFGKPDPIDFNEPQRVADTVAKLELKHVVITSVTRDDLDDGGALQFVKCVEEIRATSPSTTIELLVPDFAGKGDAWKMVADSKPDVFNHNIETVPRLFPAITPMARYFESLILLHKVREYDPSIFTKSGLMVGLGETKKEILQVMDDLHSAGVDFITIGQYLQPSEKHIAIDRYVHPDEFKYYEKIAYNKGFKIVSSSPMTRSSYHADEDFKKLKKIK